MGVTDLNYVTVDVFTEQRFGGNQLAVVLNAQGLETAQMQAIANEFNFAETTFVLPPANPAHTAQVRIFTPKFEMPFAGHPNVGTAFVLAQRGDVFGKPIGDALIFEEQAGLVRMELHKENGATIGARLMAPQKLEIGEQVSPALVAETIGLKAGDIETARHAPCIASCGATFLIAELKSAAALAAACTNQFVFERNLPVSLTTGLYLYVQEEANDADIQCRMFAPLGGIQEDPATGSAAVALIGLLASLREESELVLSKTLAQGFQMGRPSLLEATAHKTSGNVTATFVGGRCVNVMRGVIEID